jgi:D-beta-D-heptose 7-phosphate kinase/D-beta-D-heptose 1-phosphate adenosyltransferase
MQNWREILDKFADVRVLIVGDVMLDRYFWGTVARISPEAPVPVVRLEKQTVTAGGAANVAANVAALGAKSYLLGIIGNDQGASELKQILEQSGVNPSNLIQTSNRQTTTKTRIVAHHQHVVRLDDEKTTPLDALNSEQIRRKVADLLPASDVVVLSDYAKGCLSNAVLAHVIEESRKHGKPILVDPKGRDYQKYAGATVLTPNKSEASAASAIEITDEESLKAAGEKLLAELKTEALLITLGEDGMRLFERNRKSVQIPAAARDVYDVTGAGDTVIASIAVALGAGANFADAARIANSAAGIVVEQIGTTAVKKAELEKSLQIETAN